MRIETFRTVFLNAALAAALFLSAEALGARDPATPPQETSGLTDGLYPEVDSAYADDRAALKERNEAEDAYRENPTEENRQRAVSARNDLQRKRALLIFRCGQFRVVKKDGSRLRITCNNGLEVFVTEGFWEKMTVRSNGEVVSYGKVYTGPDGPALASAARRHRGRETPGDLPGFSPGRRPGPPGEDRADVREGMTANVMTTVVTHGDNHDHSFCPNFQNRLLRMNFGEVAGNVFTVRIEEQQDVAFRCSTMCRVCSGSCDATVPNLAGHQNVKVEIQDLRFADRTVEGKLVFRFPGGPFIVRFAGPLQGP